MDFLPLSAWFAVGLTALYIGLIVQVILVRRRLGVGFGDGGDKRLRGALRAQVNAGEQIPIFLILLGLSELASATAATGLRPWLVFLGLTFLTGRIIHAYGMSFGAHLLRVIGTAANLSALILLGITLFIGML